MDRSMRLMTVFVILLLISVTIPLSYILFKNVGMEKVRVMRSEIMSSDVDADGHIYLFVRQYQKTFTGYRSANEFMKKEGTKGYQPQSSWNYLNNTYPSNIFLIIKDTNGITVQKNLIKKNTIWSIAILKQYNGEIYIAWNELHLNEKTGNYDSEIKFSKVGVKQNLTEVHVASLGPIGFIIPLGLEIIPNPIRAIIRSSDSLFIVNGTNVKRALVIMSGSMIKTMDSHLLVLGIRSLFNGQTISDYYELDEKLNIIRQDNFTLVHGSLFQTKNGIDVFFATSHYKSPDTTVNSYIYPISNSPINISENTTQMIDNDTGPWWEVAPLDLDMEFPSTTTANERLFILHGENYHYPMMVDIYDINENYSREKPQYFNFTLKDIHQIGSASYIIGYIEQWTQKEDFPQLIVQKFESQ